MRILDDMKTKDIEQQNGVYFLSRRKGMGRVALFFVCMGALLLAVLLTLGTTKLFQLLIDWLLLTIPVPWFFEIWNACHGWTQLFVSDFSQRTILMCVVSLFLFVTSILAWVTAFYFTFIHARGWLWRLGVAFLVTCCFSLSCLRALELVITDMVVEALDSDQIEAFQALDDDLEAEGKMGVGNDDDCKPDCLPQKDCRSEEL